MRNRIYRGRLPFLREGSRPRLIQEKLLRRKQLMKWIWDKMDRGIKDREEELRRQLSKFDAWPEKDRKRFMSDLWDEYHSAFNFSDYSQHYKNDGYLLDAWDDAIQARPEDISGTFTSEKMDRLYY